jgi:hypothetical protein
MIKIDLDNMSLARKTAFTIIAGLYILAILGNARHGFAEIVSVTLAFCALETIAAIWIK